MSTLSFFPKAGFLFFLLATGILIIISLLKKMADCGRRIACEKRRERRFHHPYCCRRIISILSQKAKTLILTPIRVFKIQGYFRFYGSAAFDGFLSARCFLLAQRCV